AAPAAPPAAPRPVAAPAPAAVPAPRPAEVAAPHPTAAADEARVSLSDLRADAEAAASALAEQIDSDTLFENAEAIDEMPAPAPAISSQFLSDVPDEALAEAADAAPVPRAAASPDEALQVDFEQSSAPPAGDVVKHVKVRSNVDILSELEKLRKNATLKPMPAAAPRPRSGAASLSIDDLLSTGLNHRKEVQKLYEIEVRKKDLNRAERLVFSVRLDDARNKAIGEEREWEIELSDMHDIEKLLVSLKLHVSGK
ncbi:MAG TPA: hypothetical protein VG777_05600, partial [Thermoanaerobaculia bacterium]|nr:hypothetical protein [Thermoanaerobaculia bacterium]